MGRAKKNPEYDPEKVMEQFTNCIVDAYGTGTDNNSLRKISEQFGITLMKTRKILITAGVYHTEISDQINSLWEDNWSISDIMKETGLSRSSVHSYLPYLLNCILLLPAGALLPVITNHKVKWYQALLFGVLISAVIETSQLVFMRGLFEWDDMIHNGLGCMVGCLVVDGGVNK